MIRWALILAGLVVVYFLPRWQGRHHQKLIRENGSLDTLKRLFHHKWTAIRAFILLATALAIHAPEAGAHALYLVRVGLFTGFAFYYFGAVFTPALNVARNLPPWHVSRDARAALTDRTLVALAIRLKVPPEWLARWVFLVGTALALALYLLTYFSPFPGLLGAG